MKGDEFIAWLESVTLTKPFTLSDALELRTMIKHALADAVSVEVVGIHAVRVHVRIETPRGVLERDIDVV